MLYVAKDYAATYGKYSEAIEIDSKNAVLYANRAACSLAIDKYAFSFVILGAYILTNVLRFLDAADDCIIASIPCPITLW